MKKMENVLKKLRSNKGISMMSLLIYVVAFLMVAGIISVVTTFFYNNFSLLDQGNSVSAEYNKLNLCLVKESKEKENNVFKKNDVGHTHLGQTFFLTKSEYDANKIRLALVENDFEIDDSKGQSENDANFMSTIKINYDRYKTQGQLLNSLWIRANKFYDSYVIFYNEDIVGFRKDENCIYFNNNVLCRDVKNFGVNTFAKNGKTVLEVYVEFEKKAYTTQYTF